MPRRASTTRRAPRSSSRSARIRATPPRTRTSATCTPSSRARPTTRRCSSTRPTPAAQNKLRWSRELVGRPGAAATAAAQPLPRTAANPEPAPVEKPKPAPRNPLPRNRLPLAEAAPAADASAEVLKAVNGWAASVVQEGRRWLSRLLRQGIQDARRARRAPPGKRARRSRITAPKSIAVGVDAAKVTMNGADHATVTLPPELPLRRAQDQQPQDAGDGAGTAAAGRSGRRKAAECAPRFLLRSSRLPSRAARRRRADAGRPPVAACSKSIEAQPASTRR